MASRGAGVKSSTARCVVWPQPCSSNADGARGAQVPARSRVLLLPALQHPIISQPLAACCHLMACPHPAHAQAAWQQLYPASLSPCLDINFSRLLLHPALVASSHTLPLCPCTASFPPCCNSQRPCVTPHFPLPPPPLCCTGLPPRALHCVSVCPQGQRVRQGKWNITLLLNSLHWNTGLYWNISSKCGDWNSGLAG